MLFSRNGLRTRRRWTSTATLGFNHGGSLLIESHFAVSSHPPHHHVLPACNLPRPPPPRRSLSASGRLRDSLTLPHLTLVLCRSSSSRTTCAYRYATRDSASHARIEPSSQGPNNLTALGHSITSEATPSTKPDVASSPLTEVERERGCAGGERRHATPLPPLHPC